jgi:hypothetical protein
MSALTLEQLRARLKAQVTPPMPGDDKLKQNEGPGEFKAGPDSPKRLPFDEPAPKPAPKAKAPVPAPKAPNKTPAPKPVPGKAPAPAPGDGGDANREAWLTQALEALREVHPNLTTARVSVGYGPNRRGTKRLLGYTVPGSHTVDGVPQLFVTPVAETAAEALTVLSFEACRATAAEKLTATALGIGLVRNDDKSERAAPFKPMLHSDLAKLFATIETQLGPYPHAGIKPDAYRPRDSGGIKVSCANGKGYVARVSQKWISAHGAPLCGCCQQVMKIEG